MARRWSLRLLVLTLGCLSVTGCQNCFRRSCGTCSTPSATMVAPPPTLPTASANQPPGPPPNLPTAPAPTAPGSEVRNYAPLISPWQPYTGDTRSLLPQQSQEPPRDGVRLLPPGEKPPALPTNPQSKGEASPATGLPADIPQFAFAQDRKVATGLKPFPDGLDWLRVNGYRTVLHIIQPGEDDAADRRQVEKYGLKYLSLELSPQSLSRATVEQFGRTVNDAASQPLFVYDRDGALAGGLWYLHFRTVDKDSDDVARIRAGPLGLKPDSDGTHRTMWVAIQKYASENLR